MIRPIVMLVGVLMVPCVVTAQDARHVVIVTGLSGEPAFAKRFNDAARQVFDTAKARWRVSDSSLIWLGEDPAADPARIRGRATRELIDGALARIAKRAAPGDIVLVLLIGHGSGQGEASKVSLPGPDPVASDYRGWMDRFASQRVVIVVAASGSGDFVPVLAKAGRVVISATKSSTERNESVFSSFIARGLTTDEADADKDGTTSILEAYTFARNGVGQSYTSRNLMVTEHAILDDNGDGKGTPEPAKGDGSDGTLSRSIMFARPAAVSSDPRVASLQAERRALEVQVEQLRARKTTTDSVAYQRELEALLLSIAQKSRAIRALQPAGTP